MRRSLVLTLVFISAAAAMAVFLIDSGTATAQAPPNPPPETTTMSCCRVLATSARTVAGPGLVKLSAFGPPDIIFESSSHVGICATAENTGTKKISLAIYQRFERVAGRGFASHGDITSAEIDPGQTASACRDDAMGAVINFDAPGASYMWRVDRFD
jgi:hypothetical protein